MLDVRRSLILEGMVKRLKGIFALAAVTAIGHAAAIPGLYNTGVDNSNALLPGGTNDPHWTVTYGAGPTVAPAVADDVVFGGCCGLAPWMTNGPASKWISIANTEFVPTGTVLYGIVFDLTGFDASTASIIGGMAADGHVIDISINGNSLGLSTTYNTWDHFTSFTINSGFVSGLNVLAFSVNHEDGDFDAFRAELSGTAQPGVPEPGTLALMGAALCIAGLLRWRRSDAPGTITAARVQCAAPVTSGEPWTGQRR
jgi:hypothetical protein